MAQIREERREGCDLSRRRGAPGRHRRRRRVRPSRRSICRAAKRPTRRARADRPRRAAAHALADAACAKSRWRRRSRDPRRNIFCVGKNYHEHAKEFASSGFDSSAASGAVPKHPIIFSKVPECVDRASRRRARSTRAFRRRSTTRPNSASSSARGGRGITPDDALDHVWGYTIINDVTARDLQGRYSQWLIGKSQDTFCPMGPWAVTRDEIDLADTSIQLLDQRRIAPGRQHARPHLRRADHHRDDLGGRDLAARRRDRHRHAGRRRHRLQAAANISCPATSRASRSPASACSKTRSRRRGA